jgi:uncharacterized protein (DUF1330 family)
MPAYVMIQSRVKDPQKYQHYLTGLSEMIDGFGGRFLVGGGRVTPINEGMVPDRRQPDQVVLLEFQSEVHLRRYTASPEYRSLSKLRNEGADSRVFLLEGYKPEKT